ncbi:hypothetical protein [Runella sp. SP2]|uniref:hypothetical protein n=1 Tax=Runella sp. SP2 TaxID=2268026 RepID=UPI000F07654D|nr:hypothetical protein [Runella sp. SP2]AYQ30692.1 hypothetical protein DTQ70_00180 [Runella sp. SP2]
MKKLALITLFYLTINEVFCQIRQVEKLNSYVNLGVNQRLTQEKPQRLDEIRIIYSSHRVTQECGTIQSNIKDNFPFNQAIVNIQKFVAEHYTEGGTWDNRMKLAMKIMTDIMTNQKPIAGVQSANYMANEPFAKDLLLFLEISRGNDIEVFKYNNQYKLYIEQSADTEIPLNIISNHPLLLVNNKREPRIISTSKSISIK